MTSISLPLRYDEEGRVGGRLVLALDRLTGRSVAIKLAAAPTERAARDLAHEFSVLAACEHPNIPRALDFGKDSQGRAFLVMERARGRRPTGPMPLLELVTLGEGLCEGLSLLHSRGLLHRDLKPANVHFEPESGRVMLLDLGLAEPESTATEVRGTVGYLAPEVLGNGRVDRRADLYSLGSLLYEVATGQRPFEGSDAQILLRQRDGRFEPPNRRRPELPSSLAALIGALLDPRPDRRPSDARDVRDRLVAAVGSASTAPTVLAPAFVGRERALDQLEEGAELALERTVRLAVSGPAGSGRTRLLGELRARLLVEGALVVHQSLQAGDEHPFSRLSEELLAAVAVGPERREAGPLAACREAVERVCRSLPSAGRSWPLVLLLEDLDRADAGVLQDVESLWSGLEALPLLMVTSHDPNRLRWPPRGGARIDLPPLSETERQRLVNTALLGPAPAAVLSMLRELGANQPRPVLDSLRGWLDAGSLQRVGGRFSLTEEPSATADDAEPNPTALSPGARSMARVLAALESEAPLDEVAAMAGLEARAGQASARELLACGLAELSGGRVGATSRLMGSTSTLFSEAELRAAHDGLLERRHELSSESSRALRLTQADGAESFRLRHEARGTRGERAVAACLQLAEQQLRQGTTAGAVRMARLGLSRLSELDPSPRKAAAAQQARLHAAECEALKRAGRMEEALEAAEARADAAKRSDCPVTRVEALSALGATALRAGAEGRAEQALQAALEVKADGGAELPARLRARLLLERAAVDRRRGATAAAEERLAEAGYLLCGSNDVEGEARVLVARARLEMDRGQHAAATQLLHVAVKRFQELDQPLATARALRDLGWCESLAGSPRRAQRTLRTALNLAEKHADRQVLAGLHVALGAVASSAGSPCEAVSHYRRALAAFQALGDLPGQLAAMNNLAWQLFVGGEIAAAVTAFREVLDLRQRSGLAGSGEAMARNNLGLALCAAADYAEALECCRRAHEEAESSGDLRVAAEACWGQGRVYAALGATEDGLHWQRRALETAQIAANPLGRCYALSEMGTLFVREGRLEAAADSLRDAVETARQCGERGLEALCSARLGAVAVMRGRLGEGVGRLREGLSIAVSSGDRLVQLEVERLLGAAFCELGDFASGLPLLEESVQGCLRAGYLAELPSAHGALAAAHLRRALRLKTSTGAIVDRAEIEAARAELERGLDLTLSTGRMADRVQLRVLSTAVRLVEGDTAAVPAELEEARRLADETGDRLAAERSRLLEAEAHFVEREFGEALRQAREACAQLESIGFAEDTWRAHALVSRIHGAWGMADSEAEAAAKAEAVLRGLELTIDDERLLRSFLADVERRAALRTPSRRDGSRRRRVLPAAIDSRRFAGQVDVEELVEELLEAKAGLSSLELKCRERGSRLRKALSGLRLFERSTEILRQGQLGAEDLRELLGLVARCLRGERAFLLVTGEGGLEVRGGADADGLAVELPDHALSGGIVRRVIESGRPALTSDARRDGRFADMESVRALDLRSIACVPLMLDGRVLGALYVDDTVTSGTFRRRDLRLLAGVARLVADSLASRDEESVNVEVRVD